ncbi:phosphoheptose isomerase [Candidatus Blochmanniella vafra str. BVAF]|uniref:Phosphoheptose isomerase n=1 Tax=Blochmanniella vafra (strain BVAF) TaxID=859654 RepID=E8Q611_BLOVB|nr:D-sedoheptulose 7-phosphate isomerase [Candidatus Blochmannia vafer]ADV33627.1 phosphoheptose isomerase [Candidatus Blochmannia vafer str. BVAF]
MYGNLIFNEFNKIIGMMKIFLKNSNGVDEILISAKLISDAFKLGGKVLSCGNGGSLCHAMHFAEELTGRYRENRIGYPAIAISDPSYLSCVSNDFGYENVFSRYVKSIGNKKDVLLAISSSGESVNILNAIEEAHNIGMKVIFLTRESKLKNKFSSYVDVEICAPFSRHLDHIQEMHMKIIHVLVLIIEKEMLSTV